MNAKSKKFEDELKDLEEIVSRIDSGELGLEDSIAAFERGVALVRSLNQKLDEAEKKVEVLAKNAQGELRTSPLEVPAGESAPRPSDKPGPGDDSGLDE